MSKCIMFNNSKCLHDTRYDNDDNNIIEAEYQCKGDFDGDGKDEIAFFDINGMFMIIKDNHKYYIKYNKNDNDESLHDHIVSIDTFNDNNNAKEYIIILYMNGLIRILLLNNYNNDHINMNIITEQSNLITNSTCMKTFLYKNTILLLIGDRRKLVIYASKLNTTTSSSSSNNTNGFNFHMICEEIIGTTITSLDHINDSDFIVLGLITGATVVYQIESFSYYIEEPTFDSPSQISTRTSTPGIPSLTRSPTPLNITRQSTPALYLPFIPLYQHITPALSTPDIATNTSIHSDIVYDESILENPNDIESIVPNRSHGQTSIIHTQPKRMIPLASIHNNDANNNENPLSLEKPLADSRSSSAKHLHNISHLVLKLIHPALDDVLGLACDNNYNTNNTFVTLPTYVSAGTAVRKSVIASNNEYIFAVARLDGRVSFCHITSNEIEHDSEISTSYSWQTIYAIQIEDSPYKIDFINDEIIDPCILYNDNYNNEATSTYCCGVHSRGGRTLFINLEVMTDYNIFQAIGKSAPPIVLLFDSELLIGEEASRNFCYANNNLYYVTCTGSIHVITDIKEQLALIGSSCLSTKFKPETISMIKFLLESMSTYYVTPINKQFEEIMKLLPQNCQVILSEAVTKYLSATSSNDNMNIALQYVLDELMKLPLV